MTRIDANAGGKRLPVWIWPVWIWVVVGLGVAWNLFGLIQLFDFVTQTHASLMMKGMNPAAADLYYALPIWMKLAFAAGSIGGVAGCVALAARQPIAVLIFSISLLGYIALLVGDYAHGVFAVIPGQMAILAMVVGIAAALLGVGLVARRRGLLDR